MTAPTHTLTDIELQRRIGELSGWKDIEPDSYWYEDYFDTREVRCLFGVSPNHGGRVPLPRWPTDEGAALRACMDVARERGYKLEIWPDRENVIAARFERLTLGSSRGYAEAPTLARALAELLAAALEPQP